MVLHEHADHAARRVGLPVLALGSRFFRLRQLFPPAQLFEQDVVQLRVAGGDVSALGVGAVFGQQALAFTLDAEVGAEVTAAVHDVLGGVVQVG